MCLPASHLFFERVSLQSKVHKSAGLIKSGHLDAAFVSILNRPQAGIAPSGRQVVWPSQKRSSHYSCCSRFRWFKDATELNISLSQKSCHYLSCLSNACWQIKVPGVTVRTSNELIQLLTGVMSHGEKSTNMELEVWNLHYFNKAVTMWASSCITNVWTQRWWNSWGPVSVPFVFPCAISIMKEQPTFYSHI